jgi:hypothetical protein
VTDIVYLDANVSSRINLTRILLISGIVFVHVPFGSDTSPFDGTYGPFDGLRVFPRDGLFRVGVPSLSAISGYLLFRERTTSLDFSFSIYTSIHRIDLKMLDRHAVPISGCFLAITVVLSTAHYRTGPDFPTWLDVSRNLMVLAGILGFWALSAVLVHSRLGRQLAQTDGASFLIFCAHFPFMLVLWMAWNQAGPPAPYPFFCVLAVAVTLTVLPLTNALVRNTMPSLHNLLTGSGWARQLREAGGETQHPYSLKHR